MTGRAVVRMTSKGLWVPSGFWQRASVLRLGMSFIALGLVLVLSGCAAQVSFQSPSISHPATLSGHLYRPEGPGPFPALVLLHTCGGLAPHVFSWAEWLKGEGYVALVVDSSGSRGLGNFCDRALQRFPVSEMARDAFGALTYLRSQPFVNRERIGVMGWSYGAMASLQVASERFAKEAQPQGGGFRVAVPFYPHCRFFAEDTNIPVLLLLGGVDDWTPPGQCVERARRLQQEGRPVSIQVYPGTHHGFDQAELGTRVARPLGHTIMYSPAATSDSEKQVRAFLAQHLRRTP